MSEREPHDELATTDEIIPDLRDEQGRPKLTTEEGDLKGPDPAIHGEEHASADPTVSALDEPGLVGVNPGEVADDPDGEPGDLKGPDPAVYPAPAGERFRQEE